MLVAGLALTGCNKSTRTSTASTEPAVRDTTTTTTTTSGETVGSKLDRAGDRMADATRNAADSVREASHDAANAVRNAGHDLSARMTEWRLNNSDIEADIRANREIVRSNTSTAPTGKVDKGNIEKSIKGRLDSDPMFNGQKFDANCNSKGEVTLEGKARTVDQIAHAIAVALDTDGVATVKSKIKLDEKAGKNP